MIFFYVSVWQIYIKYTFLDAWRRIMGLICPYSLVLFISISYYCIKTWLQQLQQVVEKYI